jgi:heme/copper-type cytochrome/quinol oxidase subunit 2
MSEKAFRFGMWFVMVLGAAGLLTVIVTLSPYINQNSEERNFLNIVFFYVSCAFFLAGFFGLLLFKLRKKITKENNDVHMGVSLRQGILLSIIIVVILILQSFRVLTWWDGLLVVGAVLMVELYFLAR